MFGAVIGVGGSVRRRLAEDYHVDIWVPSMSSSKTPIAPNSAINFTVETVRAMTDFDAAKDLACIQITGPKDANVKQAVESIMALLRDKKISSHAADPNESIPANDASYSATLEIPASAHRIIIGRKGTTIQQLRNKHSCNIVIPPQNTTDEVVIAVKPRPPSTDASPTSRPYSVD